MIVYERAVRFHEVDAAGLLYFPRFASFAHEAMETLFDALDGGYVRLITERRIGLPAVRVQTEFSAPLRFGDRVRIATSVSRLGKRSLALRYRFLRPDAVQSAEMLHTVVVTDLTTLRSCEMPADLRAVAEAHLETA